MFNVTFMLEDVAGVSMPQNDSFDSETRIFIFIYN